METYNFSFPREGLQQPHRCQQGPLQITLLKIQVKKSENKSHKNETLTWAIRASTTIIMALHASISTSLSDEHIFRLSALSICQLTSVYSRHFCSRICVTIARQSCSCAAAMAWATGSSSSMSIGTISLMGSIAAFEASGS